MVPSKPHLDGSSAGEEDSSCDAVGYQRSKGLQGKGVAEDLVEALCRKNGVLGQASSDTCVEVEDEDNALHHLYSVNRMVVAQNEAFPHAMFRMSWMEAVVALVEQEVSPW